jgi:hypothetical protein
MRDGFALVRTTIRKLPSCFRVPPVPTHPSYIHQLRAILEEASAPKPIPFFRRRDREALFGLEKRQALHLMHRIGAVRVSRELALDQRDLVRWLDQPLADPSAHAEWQRHEKVIERMVELKAETAARAVRLRCRRERPAPTCRPACPSLPACSPSRLDPNSNCSNGCFCWPACSPVTRND